MISFAYINCHYHIIAYQSIIQCLAYHPYQSLLILSYTVLNINDYQLSTLINVVFSQTKVGCITVNMAPVKAAVDDLLQRLFDTLLFTLRHSISTDAQQANQFLNDAIATLSSRPQTIEEIAEANAKHHAFGKQKSQLKPLFEKMEAKNKLLRSVAGTGVESLGQVQQQWEKFELMLDSHQLMIKEQVRI